MKGTYLSVDLDVDVIKVLDGVLLKLFFVTELLESDGEKTVLLAPVTQVVDGDRLVSDGFVDLRDEVTDDRGSKMSSVEWLRNVWRAVSSKLEKGVYFDEQQEEHESSQSIFAKKRDGKSVASLLSNLNSTTTVLSSPMLQVPYFFFFSQTSFNTCFFETITRSYR